ncbi:MAG: ammonium transporter [Phycisphaeraceae bacterium]|nr:ammonium transporter [Phycisphaeraceae bacterium]
MSRKKWLVAFSCLAVLVTAGWATCALGQAEAVAGAAAAVEQAGDGPTAADVLFTTNNLWMMVAASLVFIMNLGFAMVETGLTRAKNTVNILFKNTIIPCLGVLIYALVGFNLMYPGFSLGKPEDGSQEFFKFAGFWISDAYAGVSGDPSLISSAYNAGYTYYTDFLFQAMFAATAATIVSGAVAERIKFSAFIVWTVLFTAFSYPITGSWLWGGGWLETMGFKDFAGSTLVHSVGGWGALVGAIMVGPRLGKYNKDGSSNAIPGHSLALATIGVFMLWWGWFGFNGGSVLSADPGKVSLVLVTTTIAACAGAVTSMFTSWLIQKKPDFSMVLNGVLAGLVAITAGADIMNAAEATIIGAVGGVIVVLSVLLIDQKLRIDDPVGALSVHLVNGVWGTLACGLFGDLAAENGLAKQFGIQLTGVVSIGLFTVVVNIVLWGIIKAVMGMRVSDLEQIEGLDLGEHDTQAYPDFQRTYIKSYHAREI